MPKPKLPPDILKANALIRSKRSNAKAKAKRDAERALGIPPSYKPLTDEQKRQSAIRVKEWRAKKRIVKPKPTKEELRIKACEKTRAAYERKLIKEGKTRTFPPRYLNPKSTKIVKMEKILKSRPANRISEKVIKPVKDDLTKQIKCEIKANDSGRIKVRLNAKTEVFAKPGYVLEDLKRKFGIA